MSQHQMDRELLQGMVKKPQKSLCKDSFKAENFIVGYKLFLKLEVITWHIYYDKTKKTACYLG